MENELSWLKKARPGKDLLPETREVAVLDPDQGPGVVWGRIVGATKKNNPNLGAEADRLHQKFGLLPGVIQDLVG